MSDIYKWDPKTALLTDPDIPLSWKTCVLTGYYFSEDENNDTMMGVRISSIFVILFCSTALTMFPLLSKSFKWIKMPLYVYLFARHFGTGVIVATAFIHLLDPAYQQIGHGSCVGTTGNWNIYPWPCTLMLTAVFVIFFTDIASDVIVHRKYGVGKNTVCDQDEIVQAVVREDDLKKDAKEDSELVLVHDKSDAGSSSDVSLAVNQRGFRSQIAAFLILEFGIIFHSVMIGLNLGATGDEFKTLYIVLIFHQSFEGLGIGARLSAIPWPQDLSYIWAYMMCLAYGIVTPISIAIGLAIRHTFKSNSYSVGVISGVLDSISAGILMYSGLVELLARDFIFNPAIRKDLKQLAFALVAVLAGAATMGVIGKWA